MRPCARADDAKIVRSRDAQLGITLILSKSTTERVSSQNYLLNLSGRYICVKQHDFVLRADLFHHSSKKRGPRSREIDFNPLPQLRNRSWFFLGMQPISCSEPTRFRSAVKKRPKSWFRKS